MKRKLIIILSIICCVHFSNAGDVAIIVKVKPKTDQNQIPSLPFNVYKGHKSLIINSGTKATNAYITVSNNMGI